MHCFRYVLFLCTVMAFAAYSFGGAAAPGELKILLPQSRTAFQTNEWIDVSVLRSSPEALPPSTLSLNLVGKDGSKVAVSFPLRAVALQGKEARATEHYHFNGWLLRPGQYTIEAKAGDATASTEIGVYSHIRKSDFRLVNWGRAKGKEQQLCQGEDSLGFNLFYGHYGHDEDASFIRAGVDYMSNCTMGGAHQMDIRQECDWSDPLVIRVGTARVVRRAMIDRNRPNVQGVHFYDEPGLTWVKNDATGEVTPHMIPSQVQSYIAAFGKQPLPYHKVDPKNPEHVAAWNHWARWKLGFMEAEWKESQFGVSQVRPDFLSLTQSQYGWSAYTDGYYFNVVRTLPITSGHGGYHDFGLCYFNPSWFLEMARARDFGKPCWYLPTWYGNTTADQFRGEQYLSFQTNLQGMISPPDLEPAVNATGRQGIVESNHLMKKLGPIFITMPVTKPPVALLYSLSQAIHSQTKDMKANYLHQIPHGNGLASGYLAGKLIGQQFLTVVEEDVLDGTLAADHKAIVLVSLDYLDPAVVASLENFARAGGLVLLTSDSTVAIKGAVKLAAAPKKVDAKSPTAGQLIDAAMPLAKAVRAELDKAGIKPIMDSDVPTISMTRQAAGDIEYLFAVNASYGETARTAKGEPDTVALKSSTATLALSNDGRPVYDAIIGGPVAQLQPKGDKLTGPFRFGPGQMRVFARTARPIGGIRAAAPVVVRELAREEQPIRVDIAASLLDSKGSLLSGSAPLHIQVIDPFGATRHELFRATKQGMFNASLTLAANDPAGQWKVVIRELLNNTEDTVAFRYAPPPHARSVAGATARAIYASNDRDNAYRFARLFHEVTIVKGTSPFNDAAAERLTKILAPWGVRCKQMDLKEAAKSRTLTAEEAKTWCGLAPSRAKPGDGNAPNVVGFAVQGPVILLGNPDDNPIIKFLLTEKFLPYTPAEGDFPGAGRGMIAWQRNGVGHAQESITLIAHDERGMSEAVGSLYEAIAGLEPLTKWNWPQSDEIAPAQSVPGLAPAAMVVWSSPLPDRVEAIKVNGDTLTALTHDGSLTALDAQGKLTASKTLTPGEIEPTRKELGGPTAAAADLLKIGTRPDRMLKLSATGNGQTAIAYWGGTLRIVDASGTVLTEQMLPQDITALNWQGGRVIAGLADGRVLALMVKK